MCLIGDDNVEIVGTTCKRGWRLWWAGDGDREYPPPRLETAPSWTERVPPSPISLTISSVFGGKGRLYDVDKPNAHF